MKIYRSINEPIRDFIDMEHRWRVSDHGLIFCWERGRQISQESPDLAIQAKNGELMILVWRGGVHPGFKGNKKKGTLNYLAQWQGLAGKDLDIDTEAAITIICSKT